MSTDLRTHPKPANLRLPVDEDTRASTTRYPLAVTRLALGWVFLWAFLDKTFGLGFATQRADAWVNGGSPTFGFLNFGTEGKLFHDFFAGLAGTVADWSFMLGLLGIGVALTLGIGMRLAAAAGALLMLLMWVASLPLENNPFVDEHVVYAVALIGLAALGAGRTWGLGRTWESLPVIQRLPILK